MPVWCKCVLSVRGEEPRVAEFVASARGGTPRYRTEGQPFEMGPVEDFSFQALDPVPDEVLKASDHTVRGRWEIGDWGCHGGVVRPRLDDRSDGQVRYHFDTAWRPPLGLLGIVADEWHDLAFTLEYGLEGRTGPGTACWEHGYLARHDGEGVEDDFGFELGEDEEDEDDEDEEDAESLAGTDAD